MVPAIVQSPIFTTPCDSHCGAQWHLGTKYCKQVNRNVSVERYAEWNWHPKLRFHSQQNVEEIGLRWECTVFLHSQKLWQEYEKKWLKNQPAITLPEEPAEIGVSREAPFVVSKQRPRGRGSLTHDHWAGGFSLARNKWQCWSFQFPHFELMAGLLSFRMCIRLMAIRLTIFVVFAKHKSLLSLVRPCSDPRIGRKLQRVCMHSGSCGMRFLEAVRRGTVLAIRTCS